MSGSDSPVMWSKSKSAVLSTPLSRVQNTPAGINSVVSKSSAGQEALFKPKRLSVGFDLSNDKQTPKKKLPVSDDAKMLRMRRHSRGTSKSIQLNKSMVSSLVFLCLVQI